MKPHRSRYWLTNEAKDPEAFDAQVSAICPLYEQAPQLHEQGVHVMSSDEKTGIQALERTAATQAMKPHQVERREFEYLRHGTQALIANFEVATGQVTYASVGARRTERDFRQHLEQTLASDPKGTWIFIVDQLNTHQSASLVRLVAERGELTDDLGQKGKSGILKSRASRTLFLQDETHRIRFVYLPKHTSWLNQIEIWFSILVRRVLKRGDFTSVDHLRQCILDFIDYFNQTLAKPFKWTYKGRPLNV